MTRVRYLAYSTCLFLCFLHLQAHAADINPVDANTQEQIRQQDRERQLRQQQESSPDARQPSELDKSNASTVSEAIPEHEAPCFNINQIELVGDSAREFKFALNEVLDGGNSKKPLLGSCLGATGINAVMARVQNRIIAKGFVTTRVLAAPQDIKTGVLQLTIMPGRLNAVRFTPDSSPHVSAWNALPMNKGDILNLRDIEQALENFKRVPTAEADIQIEPVASDAMQSGQTPPGFSDVVIRYQRRFPARISMSLDDSGSKTTGKYQGGITLSLDSVTTLNDLFYISYNHDLGGGDVGERGNDGTTVHYSIPWDYWLLSTTISNNHFHQQVAGATESYSFSGASQNAELKLNRLVYRSAINKTNLSLKGFLRKSNNYINDVEVEVQRRRTAGWELGFNQSWYLGKAVLEYNLGYRRGTGAQESLRAPEELFGEGTSRMKMLTGDISLSIPFSVQAPWGNQAFQYSANLRGQTNYTPLTPQDRFSIGNRYSVRGFDGEQTLVADNGWLIRNELIAPFADSGQSLYWGLDYGEVGGQSSQNLVGKRLAGTVIGLRGSFANILGNLNYDVFLGTPIYKPDNFQTHESVAGFSVNYAY